ncbi:MAG: hypothetical protein ACI4FX_00890 [Agathobacter sp.]
MKFYTKVKIKNCIKRIIGRKYCISMSNITDRKRYYIIRRPSPWAGFFANYLDVVGHIKYAQDHGYIPVVDMKNYPTLYSEKEEIKGTLNSWEYFFEQPAKTELDTAYHSKNYLLSDSSHYLEFLPYEEGNNFFHIYKDRVKEINDSVISTIPIKENILVKLKNEATLLEGRVLGVHVRGTDKRDRVKDHNLAAPVNKYIDCVKNVIKTKAVDHILLCCDEEKTIFLFEKEFGAMVITTSSFRAKDGDHCGIHLNDCNSRPLHKYNLGYEVLRDCYLLSKCDFLVFGHSNVTNTAIIWNNGKYDSVFFVENDIYK